MVTKTIELEAKTDKAVKELEDLRKEVQKLQKTVQDGNDQTKDGLDDVKKSGESAAKSLKGIGTAIKAIGIGLLLEAFNFFKETIGENQKAVDLFNTVFEAMSLAFNDFINFISDNWSKATKPVSDFFNTEAVGKVKEFGKILAVEVITRVKNLVEGIGG
jgi:ATP:corrinoid adenosyltransferase